MILRPYQTAIIDQTRDALREHRTVLIQLPTGGGKTVLTATMIGTAAKRNFRSWFICHRREILVQASRTFRDVGIPHGIIAAGSMFTPRHQVQVCSIDTLRHRVAKLPVPDLICWDEVHHIGAKTWADLFAKFPNTRHVGLSATPVRQGGAGLGDFFGHMVQGPSTKWLIEQQSLAPYRLFAPSTPDMKGVHTVAGEFNQKELGALMDKPSITGDAVTQYRKHADRKPFLAYCVSIEASKHAAQEFSSAGYRVVHVDGDTDSAVRDQTIADYRDGKLDGITSVSIFTEGTDLPGVECIIQLRPTQSLGLYLQMVGRGLRYKPGKVCMILDHAGNWTRHGLPDDEREWTLEPGRKPKSIDGPPVRQCKRCFAVYPATKHECPECGYAPPVAVRTVAEQDGELGEITQAMAEEVATERKATELQRQQAQARSVADLQRLFYNDSKRVAAERGETVTEQELQRRAQKRAFIISRARQRKSNVWL